MSENQEYKEFYIKIGKTIAELRINKKLTQEEMAHQCGMESNNLSQIERGLRNPTSKTLYSLCKTLQISLTDFFKLVEKE